MHLASPAVFKESFVLQTSMDVKFSSVRVGGGRVIIMCAGAGIQIFAPSHEDQLREISMRVF